MRQKRFPCCKAPMNEDDVWAMVQNTGDSGGTTNKMVNCPHCEANLTVFLSIYSVEANEE